MTAKEFLQQYRDAVLIADRLRNEYEKELILIDAVRSVSDNDGMPHGSGINKPTEEKAVKLADKALELKDAELEAIRIRQKVFDVIQTIPGDQGVILYERYINLKSWEEVASTVGYSKRHVYNIHKEALDSVKHFLLLHSII